MRSMKPDFIKFNNEAKYPDHIIPKIQKLGINAPSVAKKDGGAEMSIIETGCIAYEISKYDSSISGHYTIHNLLCVAAVD